MYTKEICACLIALGLAAMVWAPQAKEAAEWVVLIGVLGVVFGTGRK